MNTAFIVAGVLVTASFAAIGLARGWRREVWSLAALVVAWVLALTTADFLVRAVNGAGRAIGFALAGGLGASSPAAIWPRVAQRPLIDPERPELLIAAIFALALVVSFGVPGPAGRASGAFADRFLGLAVGCLDGYLIACALLKYGAPATLGPEAAFAADHFARFALFALAGAALILLGFGWWELRARRLARPTQRGKPPTRAPRRASRRKPPRSRPAS